MKWRSSWHISRSSDFALYFEDCLGRFKRIWYLSPMRAVKVQACLRIRAVSPEPTLLIHTSSESRGTIRQKARSLAPPNGWACAVKICYDGMLEDTNLLDASHLMYVHHTSGVWPDVWPKNKCRSLWHIFHGPVILPYILKTIWCMNILIWDFESVWPEINVGHCDLYFMVQWFCLISWRLFGVWTSLFGIMNQYDLTFNLKINVGHCDL